MGHILTLAGLNPGDLASIVDLACQARRYPGGLRDAAAGQMIGIAQLGPPFRSRLAFEIAVRQIGGQVAPLATSELVADWYERPEDLGQILSRYVSGLVVSAREHTRAEALARHASIPVVNGQTSYDAPCEGIAALLTLRDHRGRVSGQRVAVVGDGNHAAHAMLLCGALAGLSVSVGHPVGFAPDPEVVTRAREIAALTGGAVLVTDDPQEAIDGASLVYTQPWPEADADVDERRIRTAFAPYVVNAAMLERARPGVLVLHPLSSAPGDEIGAEVLTFHKKAMLDCAENRLHVAKALLVRALGRTSGTW